MGFNSGFKGLIKVVVVVVVVVMVVVIQEKKLNVFTACLLQVGSHFMDHPNQH